MRSGQNQIYPAGKDLHCSLTELEECAEVKSGRAGEGGEAKGKEKSKGIAERRTILSPDEMMTKLDYPKKKRDAGQRVREGTRECPRNIQERGHNIPSA